MWLCGSFGMALHSGGREDGGGGGLLAQEFGRGCVTGDFQIGPVTIPLHIPFGGKIATHQFISRLLLKIFFLKAIFNQSIYSGTSL